MTELTILGGGPAGLGLAYYAQRAGRPFVLYEKSEALGGMCRTLEHGAHRFDAGAHRFHDRDAEVTADLRALMGEELLPVKAPSQVWSRGRLIDFPPTPLNAAFSYGVAGSVRIGLELLAARLRPLPVVSFEDFALSRFGATLAQELLLNYSEKLWGLPACQLSPDVATRRLGGMTWRSLLMEVLLPGRKSAHIDGQFLYPRGGYGAISERLASAVPREALQTGFEVGSFELKGGKVVRVGFANGKSAEVSGRVVSTLPVTLLVRLLGDALPNDARAAAAALRFRKIRLIFLRLNVPRVSKNASIYIPESKYCVCRVYEPKNRSAQMAPEGETSLVAEVPCFSGDELDRLSDETLGERVAGELTAIGLISRESVLERRHIALPHAYPVYTVGYEKQVKVITGALSRVSNLDTLGRAGSFYYSHLHDQLRLAKDYIAGLP
jgi:protoporphyrinogen oxidase